MQQITKEKEAKAAEFGFKQEKIKNDEEKPDLFNEPENPRQLVLVQKEMARRAKERLSKDWKVINLNESGGTGGSVLLDQTDGVQHSNQISIMSNK